MSNLDNSYITPTKDSPIFMAECDHFGYLSQSIHYKDSVIECADDNSGACLNTFALSYESAIKYLHDYLCSEDGQWAMKEYPKAKFSIYLIDGSQDKRLGRYKTQKVYTISSKKATQLLNF